MYMRKFIWKLLIIILCFMLTLILFVSCGKEEKQKCLTICTEESLLYEVEEAIRYFNDSQEIPLDIQVSCIPLDEDERSGVCKKLRTELMLGKGADLYIIKDYGISGNISVSQEEMLMADPNKLLTSGVFLDLSEYIEKDKEFQSCFMPVMEAGAVNGKQYIVPITFDVTLLKSEKGKGSLTYEDCTKPIVELLETGKLKEISAEDFLFYIKDWIGNSFDYQRGTVLFSQKDVSQVLEYAVKEAQKGISEEDYQVVSIASRAYSLASSDSEEPVFQYLPFPTLDGRFSATVLSYGAISRTCQEPELAYEFLKIFWSEGFASGEGLSLPNQQYSRRYLTDSVFNVGGLTVRQDQWQNWNRNREENRNPAETAWESEKNMFSVIQQLSAARFVGAIDYLGMDVRNIFWEDGILNVDKETMQQDILTAADTLYNNARYIVME